MIITAGKILRLPITETFLTLVSRGKQDGHSSEASSHELHVARLHIRGGHLLRLIVSIANRMNPWRLFVGVQLHAKKIQESKSKAVINRYEQEWT